MSLSLALALYPPLVAQLSPTNTPLFPLATAVTAALTGIVAGALGGLAPAVKAALLPIASAMRA